MALTDKGQHDAERTGDYLRRLQPTGFAHVFTSPLRRAIDTAARAGYGAASRVDADLSEWDYGDYEGVRSVEIRKERPDWFIWRDGCPGGETPVAISARIDRFIERLATLEGDVALFSHGQFGSAFGARWIGLPIAAGGHFSLEPGSVCILGREPRHFMTPVILLWNGVAS